ncbi:ArgK/MeaB family GTPase, partial [Ilyobacter sp.]|uniref:ArgK/MeaB family GTPase n=1 Tax=Ilyobacter sp. TaxID=3100343 RepID=UPI003564DB34
SDLNTDPGVFIRSMGARGNLGGISEATGIAVDILDIYGCEYIFVETVGVGQSEVDIVKSCDTTLMVMVPGLGDDIQAIKAGVMEIGDVFVINKADRDGAQKTAREIRMMLEFNKNEWNPPVNMAVAVENQGIKELFDSILEHREYMTGSGKGHIRRVENRKSELLTIVKERMARKLFEKTYNGEVIDNLSEKVAKKETDPYSAAEIILEKINMN